ncbi:hypothetical protein CR513_48399, partial [Mucuna pruriens]
MARAKRNRSGLEGLPRVYLEERLYRLREEEEWSAVMDVLGLLLYGILLFPQVENYIDLAAMKVFISKRDRGENPTMAVLANTYYTLNYCSKQKEGSLRCCTLLLYLMIHWYPPWNEREHMIIRYGGYPNVPFLGTQGAINYKPELASRQVGYPMIRAP